MNIKLTFEVFDEYLRINLSGGNLFDEIIEVMETVKSLLKTNNRKKMLIDTINLTPPSEMQKFYIGEMGVGIFGREVKTALVSQPQYINKFFENVTVNRGGIVYVTDNEKDALDWLLK